MIRILSIETSCDETSVAILDVFESSDGPEFKPLAHIISSQVEIHKEYGGVFPAIAKREHSKNLGPVFLEALEKSKLKILKSENLKIDEELEKILSREEELLVYFKKNISLLQNPNITHIAITVGPGLEPALWVGVSFAKALGFLWNIPLIPVNHMEGHLLSILLQEEKDFKVENLKIKEIIMPAMALLVSGGHTELIYIKHWGQYKKIGQTVDDASGEAFDKVARMLELPYPGGPEISKLAESQRAEAKPPRILPSGGLASARFPRPMMYSKDFNFSFSGLKTAVLYHIRDFPIQNENERAKIAREFEDAVVEVLVSKTLKAVEKYDAKTLIVAGGVSANKHLRSEFERACAEAKPPQDTTRGGLASALTLLFPGEELTGDNALMIAIAGYFNIKNGGINLGIKADGNLSL